MAPAEHERHGQLRFVFLLLKEHPYGRDASTDTLRGISPEMIIEEDSPVADEEREVSEED